jgi:serine/threonine protein kinase
MSEPFDRALAAITDRHDPDWDSLEAEMPNEDERLLLRSLRDIARIERQCCDHTPPAPRSVPFAWGPLQVTQWIARGAHGDVYRAWDPRLEREVALKLLRTTSAGEREVTAVAEGRLLARVHHPNVVSVYGADRIDGQAGVWMEFVAGRTLWEEVEARGGLPSSEAIACAVDVCSALSAVHGARLIHRDVKAQNIIRTPDGRTVLMDFGAGEDRRITLPAGVTLTLDFALSLAAIEQSLDVRQARWLLRRRRPDASRRLSCSRARTAPWRGLGRDRRSPHGSTHPLWPLSRPNRHELLRLS